MAWDQAPQRGKKVKKEVKQQQRKNRQVVLILFLVLVLIGSNDAGFLWQDSEILHSLDYPRSYKRKAKYYETIF